MPGLLSRSKSMRLLKGHRKDSTGQEQAVLSVPPPVGPQTDADSLRSATRHARPEANIEMQGMPARPSTSGGPGDRKTQFHLKTNPVPPAHSLNDLTFPSYAESSSILFPGDVTDSHKGIIGIALGSPTVGSHWNSTPQATSTDLLGAIDPMETYVYSDAQASSPNVPAKSKLSRWKSLFKKAGTEESPPEKASFYQVAQSATTTGAARADSHHEDDSVHSGETAKIVEDRGRMPSRPTFNSDIRASRKYGPEDNVPRPPPSPSRGRARTFTAGALPTNPQMSIQRSSTTPTPGQQQSPAVFPLIPQVVVSNSPQNTSSSSSKPLLDVSIPDIKMERYSVMFGSVLQPTSSRSSSLLVRRHGNGEKLKPLSELSVKEEQESPIDYKRRRRATSPTVPSPSPRLLLFPSASHSRAHSPRSSSVPRLKQFHRSRPAPDRSPLNEMFRDAEDAMMSPELIIQKPDTSPILQPRTSINPEQSAITPIPAQSFESKTDSVTLIVDTTRPYQKFRPDEQEPEWEIVTKPAVAKASTTASPTVARAESQRLPHVTKFSALSSNPASAPLDAPSPLQRISSMRSPPLSASRASERQATQGMEEDGREGLANAMVGVARSISVSKANSPRALIRTATDLSSPERFIEKQILTPTMVEVRNRRSQRVQLVDA